METTEQPARLTGIYSQPYNEIVRPERVWKISKYFLRRWSPYLPASAVWLVIGARQLSYFNDKEPWFLAYDATLAEAAGLHVKVFRRTLKKEIVAGEGPLAAFLAKTADPVYRREGQVTKQSQTRYTVRLDDPLTPGDAAALAYWLRRHSPERVTAGAVGELLAEAVTRPVGDLRAGTPDPVPAEAAGLLTAADVVGHVFPGVTPARARWAEAADTLHTHLVSAEIAHFETQYFRRQWLPLLGPGPALLVTYLRSLCYCNETEGELRNEVTLESGELESVLQVSSRTLRRWFRQIEEAVSAENPLGPFLETVTAEKQANQKVATTYRVNLKTPLTAEDLAAYRATLAELSARVADKKFPTGDDGGGQIVLHTKKGDGQKVPHIAAGAGQKGAHTTRGDGQEVPHRDGGDGQKVAGWRTEEGHYKYYKSLRTTLGLSSLEGLFSQIPEEQQYLWHVHDGRAGDSFAAVVAGAGVGQLLARLNVQEPARSRIVARRPAPEEVMAWHLYIRDEPGLEQPTSYLVRRLREGDAPPMPHFQLASLSWEQWRAYAAVIQCAGEEQGESWPLFDVWVEQYGRRAAEELPFDVGVGLETLASLRVDESTMGPSAGQQETDGRDPAGVALWQEVLAELALQMTKATFDAWLRDTRFVGLEGETLVIQVRNEAARQWLANRLQQTIERTVVDLSGETLRVSLVVAEKGSTARG